MFAVIFDVVVEMVDDGGVFFVELDPALGRQLLDGFADVGGGGDEDVPAAVDESRDGGNVQLAAKGLDRRREDDEVVVKELPVLDQREGSVIG